MAGRRSAERMTMQHAGALKSCCAGLYESDWARLILSDSPLR